MIFYFIRKVSKDGHVPFVFRDRTRLYLEILKLLFPSKNLFLRDIFNAIQ